MFKIRSPRSTAAHAVTAERAARLYQLLTLLSAGPQTRAGLRRALHMDDRSFYRDLGLLRAAGIDIPLRARFYVLAVPARTACAMLPFPDPYLTLGDAVQLARGKSAAHRKLQAIVDQIVKQQAKRK